MTSASHDADQENCESGKKWSTSRISKTSEFSKKDLEKRGRILEGGKKNTEDLGSAPPEFIGDL